VQWPSCTSVSSCWLVILIGARILLEQDDGARGEGACQRIVLGRGHVVKLGVRVGRVEEAHSEHGREDASCRVVNFGEAHVARVHGRRVSRAPIQPAPGSCWPLSSATRFERAPRPSASSRHARTTVRRSPRCRSCSRLRSISWRCATCHACTALSARPCTPL
jgi:hypothetical protein